MSGDWIKMRNNLWDDPRVSRLCDLTNQKEATVIGGLYWLWASADEHTEDGYMPGLTVQGIDRKIGVKGFGAALVAVRWLSEESDGARITNFSDHNGTSAKRRCTDAQRKANVRSSSAFDADIPPTDDGGNAPNLGAREEKRREEKKEQEKATSDEVAGARPAADPRALALVTTPKPPKTVPDCPHLAVLALWAEVLPALPQHDVQQWRGTRADHLRARWRETAVAKGWATEADGLLYLRRLFGYVGQSPFLTGRTPSRDRRPFAVELAWLVKPENWAKTVEGKYHAEEATA